MNAAVVLDTALRLALFAAVTLVMLAWTGYGPAALLLPARLRAYGLLLLAPIGYCWFALLSSVLNSTFLPMAVATWVILALATAVNVAAWRRRRLPLALTRETAAVAALALVPFLLGVLPLLKAGSTAFLGTQWDLEVYLPITEYLKRYAIGARLEALPNPLTTLLNAPDFRGGSGWGFSYVEAGAGTLLGWPSFLTFRPLLQLLMTLSVPCVWVMARELFGLNRRAAFIVAALWAVHGLSIWLASIGLAGHAASFALLPLALTLGFLALEEPTAESIVLAGSAVAGLLLNFYTGSAPFYALPMAAYGMVLLVRGPARRRTAVAGVSLLAATLALAPVAHLRFLDALSVYASKGLSQGWSIQEFTPVADALGLSPFLLVQYVNEFGSLIGEPARQQFLQAGWRLTLVSGLVAMLGLVFGPLHRPRYLAVVVPIAAFAAFLRFGMVYPYGYFKALSLAAPFLLVLIAAGAVAVWDAFGKLPAVRTFRAPLRLVVAAVAVGFVGVTLATTALSVRYYWEPARDELPRSVWQVRAMQDVLPPGAPVQVLSRSGFNPRTAGMIAYFLIDNPLDGNLITAYNRMTPRQPGSRFEYVALLDGVQPPEVGLDPDAALWRNELVALYRTPETWQAAAYLEGSGREVRVAAATGGAALQLEAEGWSLATPAGAVVAGPWRQRPQRVQPEFTLLSVSGGPVRFALPDGERVLDLEPGLHVYRLPPVTAPGALHFEAGRPDAGVVLLSMRLLSPQDGGGTLASVQGIAALETAASTQEGFGLSIRYASPDPRGGDVVASVEVYRHTGSGTLDPVASWEVAHIGRRRHGVAAFHLDPVAWSCVGGREDSQAPPGLSNGPPPDGRYSAQLALYHMGDDVARWPWVGFSVSDGQVTIEEESPLPPLTIAYLPAPQDVERLRALVPHGAGVLVVPDPDPDRSFIVAAAGFLEGRRVVADAPLPRDGLAAAQPGTVEEYALLPADADPHDYGYVADGLLWSNRFARLYRRTAASPAALFRFPAGLDLDAGASVRLSLTPGGTRLDLPEGRSLWGQGPNEAAADVELVLANGTPQLLAFQRTTPDGAAQVAAAVRAAGTAPVLDGPGVYIYRQTGIAQPGSLAFGPVSGPITVLAVRVSAPSTAPGGLALREHVTALRVTSDLTADGTQLSLTLGTAAHVQDPAPPVIVGVDVYSRGQCVLTHYGYWALALPGGAAPLTVLLDPGRKTAEFSDRAGRPLAVDRHVWPAGDGLYRGVVFVRQGERTVWLPAFQFRLTAGRVVEMEPLLSGKLHLLRTEP